MIYLIWGYPGVGKDYIARLFSECIGIPRIETDKFLTKREKDKLINNSFTDEDRTRKLKRLVKYLKQRKGSCIVTDSLPTQNSRLFLKKHFEHQIIFILVKSPKKIHYARIENRKNHFFKKSNLDNYISKWEPIKGFSCVTFINGTQSEESLKKKLLKIYKITTR